MPTIRRHAPLPWFLPLLAAGLACSDGGASGDRSGDDSAAWVGAFRNEQRVGDLFISARLVITADQAEYNVNTTRDGALFIQQVCSAPLTVAGSTPVIPAMSCEVSMNGNRMTKDVPLDFSYNGSTWVRRNDGEETAFERVGGSD
jgi:hypothetical protein